MTNRECTICAISKPLEAFRKHNLGPSVACKKCCTVDKTRPIGPDCPYQCHVCGLGHDTKEAAGRCCMQRRPIDSRAGDTCTGMSKYAEAQGDPFYKYRVHHDWANRGSR